MLGLIETVTGVVGKVLDRVIPDTAARDKAKAEFSAAMLSSVGEIQKAAASIVLAEANGQSWLQRNWRPMLMVLFGFIIANNHVIVPYAAMFGVIVPILAIEPDMWDLLKIGVGGYVVGRSVEKAAATFKGGGGG